MIIEEDVTKPTPHKVEYKKYHVDLSEDKQIKELSEKYGLNRKTIEYYQKKLNKH